MIDNCNVIFYFTVRKTLVLQLLSLEKRLQSVRSMLPLGNEAAWIDSRDLFIFFHFCMLYLFIKAPTYLFVQLCAAVGGKSNGTYFQGILMWVFYVYNNNNNNFKTIKLCFFSKTIIVHQNMKPLHPFPHHTSHFAPRNLFNQRDRLCHFPLKPYKILK